MRTGTRQYMSLPRDVHAVQWNGDNITALNEFEGIGVYIPVRDGLRNMRLKIWILSETGNQMEKRWFLSEGDWVVKDFFTKGISICSNHEFEQLYAPLHGYYGCDKFLSKLSYGLLKVFKRQLKRYDLRNGKWKD